MIVDQQKLRIQSLQQEYEEELEVIHEEFDTERAIMIDQHNVEMNDIADILFAMEQNFQDKENEAKSEFQSMTDEIRNKVCFILLCCGKQCTKKTQTSHFKSIILSWCMWSKRRILIY